MCSRGKQLIVCIVIMVVTSYENNIAGYEKPVEGQIIGTKASHRANNIPVYRIINCLTLTICYEKLANRRTLQHQNDKDLDRTTQKTVGQLEEVTRTLSVTRRRIITSRLNKYVIKSARYLTVAVCELAG